MFPLPDLQGIHWWSFHIDTAVDTCLDCSLLCEIPCCCKSKEMLNTIYEISKPDEKETKYRVVDPAVPMLC